MGVEDDLFGHKEIEILSITNTKKLTEKLEQKVIRKLYLLIIKITKSFIQNIIV